MASGQRKDGGMKNILVICAILVGLGAITVVSAVASGMEAHRQNRYDHSGRAFFLGLATMVAGFFGGVVAILIEHA
jgi:hypothetical protein